jgi:Na+/melibiose symporter-like transporter
VQQQQQQQQFFLVVAVPVLLFLILLLLLLLTTQEEAAAAATEECEITGSKHRREKSDNDDERRIRTKEEEGEKRQLECSWCRLWMTERKKRLQRGRSSLFYLSLIASREDQSSAGLCSCLSALNECFFCCIGWFFPRIWFHVTLVLLCS